MRTGWSIGVSWLVCCLLGGLVALEPARGAETLEARVAAILARNCLECHNASDGKGSLDLTRREKALRGGDSGTAIVPGAAKMSLLWARVEANEMPPKERPALSAGDKRLLREWIEAGAPWESGPLDPFKYSSERRAGYDWWSFQPVREIDPPSDEVGQRLTNLSPERLAEWRARPIDRFILAQLVKAELTPAPEADRRTLIRRLYFDLIGLPPSPTEVEEYFRDNAPRSYERLVDRLLASPHYGERWARHWLDIVRFGESQGFERNKLRPSAWKYRDFVVEAFNVDLPYNQFIRWQIAGDVLRPDDPLAVIASGFLVMGPYDLTAYNNGTPDMRKAAREEELEGLVATVGQTFLGLTINCSRCHDHKFDPITQREFYQISAALGGTYHGDERESRQRTSPEREEQLRSLRKRRYETSPADVAERSRFENLVKLLEGGPAHFTAPKQPGPWPILARGDFRKPGDTVGPRGIAAISTVNADWSLAEDAPEAERRRALADWIAHDDNPLTARVIVNRLWSYHFGEGLVRTPSDFGFQGGKPSHPELLDWLAHELVHPSEEGQSAWSLKRIQRLIVQSATYRQSARGDARAKKVDAENRLLGKRSPRRLEAEVFRDAVLAVSGQLDRKVGGPGFRDFQVSSAGNNETYTVVEAFGGEFDRRSLYRTAVRTGTSPLLDILDCPDPSVATPRRSVTSTPLQALSLLNSPFMERYAAKFAERLKQTATDDVQAQIELGYQLAFTRSASETELSLARKFITEHGLTQWCLVLLNANEFLYVD